MSDLYRALGVKPNASRETIRKAYRGLAKKAHPDAGGDPQGFARLKQAHDILTDEKRRKRYDETGDTTESKADNASSEAWMVISVAIDHALQGVVQAGRQPSQTDMIDAIRQFITKEAKDLQAKREAMKAQGKFYEMMAKRFSAKKKDQPNVMELIIAGKINAVGAALADMDRQLVRLDAAGKIVDAHAFASDRASQQTVYMSFNMGGFGQSTSGTR